MALMSRLTITVSIALSLLGGSLAQKCAGVSPATAVKVAKGFSAYVLTNNVTSPRQLLFDPEGNLLVSQRVTKGNAKENGIYGLKIKEENGCVSVVSKTLVAAHPKEALEDEPLNHGIEMSKDGKTLFASSMSHVYAWPYDPKAMKTTGEPKSIITGFGKTGGHTTRTLFLLKSAPGMMLVSRGSVGNLDPDARTASSGSSQIRAFNVTDLSKEQKYTDGYLIGWGLRNSVGLGEHPDGGIWSNENGNDNMNRSGVAIHNDSPGEEINYHGTWEQKQLHGKNYGYPDCVAVWNVAGIPKNAGLSVGKQFTHEYSAENGITDEKCASDYVPPKITLPAHWAPIDMEWGSNGTILYTTSKGSWNRNPPDGYKVFAVTFKNGQPAHPSSSSNVVIPILSSANLPTGPVTGRTDRLNAADCPDCIRPTGISFDKGRLFVSSQGAKVGEIWVIVRNDGKPMDEATTPEELELLEKSTSVPAIGLPAKAPGA